MRPRLIIWLPTIAAVGLIAAGCGSSSSHTSSSSGPASSNSSAKATRIAVLFPGAVNDHAFNQAGYEGLLSAEKSLPIKVSYSQNVAEPDFASTLRSYAQLGYKAVIGFGFQFSSAAGQVAREFPKVDFIVESGDVSAPPNLASATNDEWQSFYMAGAAAAEITKSGKVGYVGGPGIVQLTQDGNAFRAGALKANPKVKTFVTFTPGLNDIAQGEQTALGLINEGVDVILGNANIEGVGVIHAAQSRHIYAMGAQFDQTSVAPNTVVASGVVNQGVTLKKAIQLVVDGKLQPRVYVYGLKDGSTYLGWNPAFEKKFPAAVKAVKAASAAIRAGQVPAPSTH